jgi:beta-glucosidase
MMDDPYLYCNSNLEWIFGYKPRFGVTHVDRENGFKRTPKQSAFVIKSIFDHAIAK